VILLGIIIVCVLLWVLGSEDSWNPFDEDPDT